MPWPSLIPLLPLTYAVANLFNAAHDGRAAGNQAFAIAALWGLYGLGLVMLDKHLRIPGRVVLLAALAWLVMGGLGGNGRWAEPEARWSG